ncbi:DNA repair protein RecN [Parapusillimonas granuli]|uniref:DNA repair protein RecN n=1 Tax=Parapusillimonas granuli TaxID=380911 RepID=A0A853FZ00_9BURK|nr:DNA repair protein RecN [Parapusillimonas granuli]MBB5214977.1 DNA repair protein RecN (Recombination protein N) [Parapusillimonas granuli]MEB2401164.1 DNA repair protein RecN [Alcaligenaceae bacterium]NYT49299.1 DNA repair protein RecN [Parapusillimonas granuli]
MLRTLHLRDFVIVDQAEIHFESGFTVFSGETGAGKSILIDALSLALGARGDASVLREGSSRSDITAVFEAPDGVRAWLRERELDTDDALILRRVIDSQGRSRAFINGLPANLAQLRELGEQLVDIHGQHMHQSLLKTACQRDMLDAQGNHQALARQVQQAWQAWQAAEKSLDQARRNAAALKEERERLEWQLAELERLGLQEGEWESISQDHNRLAHAQALLEGAGHALAALDDDQGSARHTLNAAAQHIQQLLRHDGQLQTIYDAIESARISVSEAVSDLNSYLDRLELNPEQLEQAERRMSAIFETARKFKVEPGELGELLAGLRERLDASEAAADTQALAEKAEKLASEYRAAADALGKARRKTSKLLAGQVSEAMQTLAMKGGRFDVSLTPCPPGPHGNENVEFLVAGHAGTTPKPLGKVASGGELARISLALSVIASRAARVPTLIFDEVDTGVGGAVAEVVGRLLRELGERHQVLCVTHLPQVAARGTHHFEVKKSSSAASTLSSIEALDEPGRVNELARMLGGMKITDTTRKHAREMLNG